jgi:uncharacterized SAM-binding protein YcdF (DUF218 family)
MRALLTIVLIGLTVWAGGFVLYAREISQPAQLPTEKADVILVLTGGASRISEGMALLAQGHADRLLISGVVRDATIEGLLARYANAEQLALLDPSMIILDPVARNTQQNAREAKRYLQASGHRHVLLVTANYHMPRSLMEMRHAMPEIRFSPYPVSPSGFQYARWWAHPTTRYLMLAEYHKMMLVQLRHLLKDA